MSEIGIQDLPGIPVHELQFEKGDMAVVLRANGTIEPLAFGIDVEAMQKPPEEMNDEEIATMIRGQDLLALVIAANSETLMELLREIANNPDVIDLEKLKQMVIQ